MQRRPRAQKSGLRPSYVACACIYSLCVNVCVKERNNLRGLCVSACVCWGQRVGAGQRVVGPGLDKTQARPSGGGGCVSYRHGAPKSRSRGQAGAFHPFSTIAKHGLAFAPSHTYSWKRAGRRAGALAGHRKKKNERVNVGVVNGSAFDPTPPTGCSPFLPHSTKRSPKVLPGE